MIYVVEKSKNSSVSTYGISKLKIFVPPIEYLIIALATRDISGLIL